MHNNNDSLVLLSSTSFRVFLVIKIYKKCKGTQNTLILTVAKSLTCCKVILFSPSITRSKIADSAPLHNKYTSPVKDVNLSDHEH
jgi:hypothetical protein